MKNIIRIGHTLAGCGTVQSGSTVMVLRGSGAARQGDLVICPIPSHGRTFIAEGHPGFRDSGVPVAFHGHRCACGCTLISSLPEASAR